MTDPVVVPLNGSTVSHAWYSPRLFAVVDEHVDPQAWMETPGTAAPVSPRVTSPVTAAARA